MSGGWQVVPASGKIHSRILLDPRGRGRGYLPAPIPVETARRRLRRLLRAALATGWLSPDDIGPVVTTAKIEPSPEDWRRAIDALITAVTRQ